MGTNNNVGSHHKRRNKALRSNSVPNSDMAAVTLPTPPYKLLTRVVVVATVLSLFFLLGISSNTWYASRNNGGNDMIPLVYGVEIVNEFPHDRHAFTQDLRFRCNLRSNLHLDSSGNSLSVYNNTRAKLRTSNLPHLAFLAGLLYWGNDTLYESTGLYGRSTLRKVDLQTGKVEIQHKMDKSIFGEGLTLLGERLYQVTWLRKTGFMYDRDNFNNLTTFTHHMNDGWGLATDGKTLFGSDGTSTLYQMDPQTMKVIQKQNVMYDGLQVRYLNELEFINGEVWANIFMTDCIVRLSPSGTVTGWILLHNLRETLIAAGEKNFEVLNGIAWDSAKQRIFVTGKLWPKLFEIKLHQIKDHSHVNIQQLCIPNVEYF